jgi:hypothetical protein
MTDCLVPKAAALTNALSEAIRTFMPYIPDPVRAPCDQHKKDTVTVAAEIRCMFESLDPPIARARQAGERLVAMFTAANGYLWACKKLEVRVGSGNSCEFPLLPSWAGIPFNPALPKEEAYSAKDILGGGIEMKVPKDWIDFLAKYRARGGRPYLFSPGTSVTP